MNIILIRHVIHTSLRNDKDDTIVKQREGRRRKAFSKSWRSMMAIIERRKERKRRRFGGEFWSKSTVSRFEDNSWKRGKARERWSALRYGVWWRVSTACNDERREAALPFEKGLWSFYDWYNRPAKMIFLPSGMVIQPNECPLIRGRYAAP